MTNCPIIQDLLPLYVDDALRPESRALVEVHLATCAECRRACEALRAGTPVLSTDLTDAAGPSEDARFLTRLKRQVGTLLGLGLVTLVLTAFAANQYGQWRVDRSYRELTESRRQDERAAFEAIRLASPDPMARLRERGGELTAGATLRNGSLRVDYKLDAKAPAERISTLAVPFDPDPRLYDPATGEELGRIRRSGSSWQPGHPVTGHMTFEGVEALPAGALAQLPYLAVHLPADEELRWEVERPAEESQSLIGQRFTVAGVEFEVERVRFTANQVQVDYRQLTDPNQVGFHLLSFRLSDRMGGTWGGDIHREELPDPLRPSQRFDYVASLSKDWLLQVDEALLILPGPSIPVEVN